jgi:phosphoadenosine phosphosulfate reductase
MRHDLIVPPKASPVRKRNAQFQDTAADTVLAHVLGKDDCGRIALVSSFGADAVVLLHMVSRIDAHLPVLFLDTELLFLETLAYQSDLADHLGLQDIRFLRADRHDLFAKDPDNLLHHFDPDACCDLRKVAPLATGLAEFDTWISGRKRYQSGTRSQIPIFETDAGGKLKVNPLADWAPGDVQAYIDAHELPRHPLVGRGYPSIGCKPCTTETTKGEDPRAGRWRDRGKLECGIHVLKSTATDAERSAA